MNRSTLLLLHAIAIAPCTWAADPAKPSLPQKAVPAFELKNKSSFAIPQLPRSPFTPVGWKPASGAAPVVIAQAKTDEGMFRVSSILLGAPSLAVINNRSYEEGQPIRMPKTGPQVRATLVRIGDGFVQIKVENEVLTVQLRQGGKLNEKTSDDLLNSDKE